MQLRHGLPVKYWWVSMDHATFALGVEDGRVVEAPQIARWTRRKQWQFVQGYYKGRGARVERLKP
jgi:hypothetical protein